MNYDLAHLLSWDPVEKLRLISALEESLTSSAVADLGEAERDELRRRYEAFCRHPEQARGWSDAMQILEAEDG